MGGVQAVLSLALISGPLSAGSASDSLGAPAPYLLGGALAALAVPALAFALCKERPAAPEPAAPAREPVRVQK